MPAPAPILELALPRASLKRLLRHPALAALLAGSEEAPATLAWHDTPGRALAAQGRALCESEAGWTLEEVRAAPGRHLPPGSAARLVRSATSLSDLGIAEADALQRVAAFDGVRRRAASGPRGIEILDGSVVARGTENATCRVRLRGIDPALAASLAAVLPVEVPGDPLPGFALRCAGDEDSPEPDRPHVAEGSVRHLADLAFGALAAGVVFWCARVGDRGAGDVEAIHQARVAIRRVLSTLRLLRPAMACPAVEAVEEELRAAFAGLGAVRDWDVFLAWSAAELPAALASGSGQGLASLLAGAGQQRARAWSKLQRHLASSAWRSALVRLAAVATLRPWAECDPERQRLLDEDAAGFGQAVLRKAHRKLLATEPPGKLPDEELHALRRRCKRFRYAAEVFAPLFPAKPARRFLRRLARVQETMGRINDMAVAARLASELATGRPFAAGIAKGWAAASGSTARRGLGDDWDRLRDAEPFWS